MNHLSPGLPIDLHRQTIRDLLLSSNRLILKAPPGAGKTTSVPLYLLEEPWMENKQIVMLEPRRIAARNAASRMADLLGEPLGKRVGYQIRAERRVSEETKILVVTEGVLTRMIQSDPLLECIALIIFDEFHERHLHSDLSLALALQTQEIFREDLKILVMSATLETTPLQTLLGHPSLIESEGRTFPITVEHLPHTAPPIDAKKIVSAVMEKLREAIRNDEGDILVFLPGKREIRQLEALLRGEYGKTPLQILPLHGELSKSDQERAVFPCDQRKIVLSTNISETSLTIEGIRIVIDSGFEKVLTFDPKSGMERLLTRRISRASAIQRAGRAGRVCEGKCYRLWSENDHHTLSPHKEPEIRQCDLTPLALELSVWGESELSWIDPPSPKALEHGFKLLEMFGAVDPLHAITPHGQQMLRLGLHPRLSHMILSAQPLGFQREALLLAALLSERDIFDRNRFVTSDIRERFTALIGYLSGERAPFILSEAVERVIFSAKELSKRLNTPFAPMEPFSESAASLLLAFAYPDRIAKLRHPKGERYLLSNQKEAILHPEDDLYRNEWLVITNSDGDSRMARIFRCAPIDQKLLEIHFSHLFRTEERIEWNSDLKRIEARKIRTFGAIVVDSAPFVPQDRESVLRTLMEGIRLHGIDSLTWSPPALSLRDRLQALHYHDPENSFGSWSDDDLLSRLDIWLLPHLSTQTSLKECGSLDLHTLLRATLTWEQRQRLDALFPEFFVSPTQSRIEIDYRDPQNPSVSIRIQEVFGLSSHPSVMEGNLPLILHLLSPAQRPIQVTRDLIGFWRGSYRDVQKELKGRYPKHYWPDDPASAQATKKTKKFILE